MVHLSTTSSFMANFFPWSFGQKLARNERFQLYKIWKKKFAKIYRTILCNELNSSSVRSSSILEFYEISPGKVELFSNVHLCYVREVRMSTTSGKVATGFLYIKQCKSWQLKISRSLEACQGQNLAPDIIVDNIISIFSAMDAFVIYSVSVGGNGFRVARGNRDVTIFNDITIGFG